MREKKERGCLFRLSSQILPEIANLFEWDGTRFKFYDGDEDGDS